ncbi:MAG: ABC transporter permease [Desulfofustis sp.]|jgi:phospholipid/cholesterol/gamma-HCH transport system permease protein|nr:ABC transporter permease [Desulfofustis sp.]
MNDGNSRQRLEGGARSRRDGRPGTAPALVRRPDGALRLRLDGDWLAGRLPVTVEQVVAELADGPAPRLVCVADTLERWDSGLLSLLARVREQCDRLDVIFDDSGLPAGVRRLLALAGNEAGQGGRPGERATLLERIGRSGIIAWRHLVEMTVFLGEATVACGRFLTGRARCRRSDLLVIMQECGFQALPIVSLISLLVGLILAFVGAVQLSLFGAQIYVASLVGIGIVRVMGAIMTGIIMAGRTGAAFAARIGTMQVNEEIDALVTLGIDPVEFLVLPRIVALAVMMPLLCLYADLMGIVGGMVVGVLMLDLNIMEYLEMTKKAVRLQDFWIGIFHSAVFGVLVALAGCHRGLRCGRSASAVGDATTSAVVTGIVSIIVATAVITVVCNMLGI